MQQILINDKIKKQLGNLSGKLKKLINTLPKNAIIAGGFVRDMYYNKPFKDLDIVISSRMGVFEHTCGALYNIFGKDIEIKECREGNDHQYNDGRVLRVWKVKGALIDIDIIQLHSFDINPLMVISGFDLSINQFVILKNEGAFGNLSRKVYNINNDRVRKERIDKLIEKYPELDWTDFRKKAEPKFRPMNHEHLLRMWEQERRVHEAERQILRGADPFREAQVVAVDEAQEIDF